MGTIKAGTATIATILLVFGLGVMVSTSPVVSDFELLNKNDQAAYCAGVFEYGKNHAKDSEQIYSFSQATKWFVHKAGGIGHLNMHQRDRAHADLERLRKAGDSSAFEDIGSVCADIILQAKGQKM